MHTKRGDRYKRALPFGERLRHDRPLRKNHCGEAAAVNTAGIEAGGEWMQLKSGGRVVPKDDLLGPVVGGPPKGPVPISRCDRANIEKRLGRLLIEGQSRVDARMK